MTFIGVKKVSENLYLPVVSIYEEGEKKFVDVTNWKSEHWFDAIHEIADSGMTKKGIELAGCTDRQFAMMSMMVRIDLDENLPEDLVKPLLTGFPYSVCLSHRLMVTLDDHHNVATITYKNRVVDDGEEGTDDIPQYTIDDILRWRDNQNKIDQDKAEQLRRDLFGVHQEDKEFADAYQPKHAKTSDDEDTVTFGGEPTDTADVPADIDADVEMIAEHESKDNMGSDDVSNAENDEQAEVMRNNIRSMTERLNEILRRKAN